MKNLEDYYIEKARLDSLVYLGNNFPVKYHTKGHEITAEVFITDVMLGCDFLCFKAIVDEVKLNGNNTLNDEIRI